MRTLMLGHFTPPLFREVLSGPDGGPMPFEFNDLGPLVAIERLSGAEVCELEAEVDTIEAIVRHEIALIRERIKRRRATIHLETLIPQIGSLAQT